MSEKIFWAVLMVGNLLGAFYFATRGDNIGLELLDLYSVYICWKELQDV